MARIRPRWTDHESAERLGGGQEGRSKGGRAIVVTWNALGTEGPICAVHTVFLGDLELLQEQVGGQEPAAAPLIADGGRENGGRERRLRHPLLREADRFQNLGRG